MPLFLDPTMLKAAKRIYQTYFDINTKSNKRPAGVAIHRETHRGQLIFNVKPILLPGEHFIPIDRLESERY